MKPTDVVIPEKRYFRIGEVSAITGIEPYVLRYWQTEFQKIRPSRSGLYRTRVEAEMGSAPAPPSRLIDRPTCPAFCISNSTERAWAMAMAAL